MNNDQRQPIYDVIISGAGPVGLFLACELALAKCSVLILEEAEDAHSPLKRIPFGIRGLSAPTIEALYLHDRLELYGPGRSYPLAIWMRQLGGGYIRHCRLSDKLPGWLPTEDDLEALSR
jgi:glycine/D-amino acid oxidase-like deaminating enzyme